MSPRIVRAGSLIAGLLVPVVVLAGCQTQTTVQSSPSATALATGTPMQPQNPQISGEIVAVEDQTMQVQGSDSQTAVTWTDATSITSQVSAGLSDVAVGSCVVVMVVDETATSVRISAAESDGTCAQGGFANSEGGPGMPTGTPPEGGTSQDMPGEAPTGVPGGEGGAPTDMPDGQQTSREMISGIVTAVAGTTVTVQQSSKDSSTTEGVTVSDSTTYTRTFSADSAALVEGQCVQARGLEDGSGGLAAEAIEVFAPTDSQCVVAQMGRPSNG